MYILDRLVIIVCILLSIFMGIKQLVQDYSLQNDITTSTGQGVIINEVL